MVLSRIQEKAVKGLIKRYIEFSVTNKKITYFKAPTGSGKTFIIANFINQLIENNENDGSADKLIFIIATLSSADLPFQMSQNLNDYKISIQGKYQVKRVDSPSSNSKEKKQDGDPQLHAEENAVYIFGKSSIGKGRILTEHGIFDMFLDQIKYENFKLIYIRDEAHYGSNEKIKKDKNIDNFEAQVSAIASYVVKMTATPPDYVQNNDIVEITEEDLNSDNLKLIKTNLIHNEDINDEVNLIDNKIDDKQILKIACKKFKQLQKEYQEYNKKNNQKGSIRPAMLIQVDSESKEKENDQFQKYINEITTILEENGLSWVKYFSNDKVSSNNLIDSNSKVSLKEISKNGANYDAILFKIGPATGWNIPRACMLVQLRNVSSKVLTTQTIGRIRRIPTPILKYEFDEESIINKYFIYSNYIPTNKKCAKYRLQNDYEENNFFYGEINKDIIKQVLNTKKIQWWIDWKYPW